MNIAPPPLGFFKKKGSVPQDGPGSYYVPNTAGDFLTLDISSPSDLYLMQDASGNLADVYGGIPLTAGGAVAYQQAVTAWTRKSVNTAQTAGQGWTVAITVGPNPALTSVAFFCYAKLTAAPGGTRDVMGIAGGTGVKISVNGSGQYIVSCKGVNVTGSVNHNDGNVHPLFLVYNRTAGTVKLFTNLETITGTYSSTVVDSTKGFGSITGTPGPLAFLWGGIASGATAESYGASTLTKLRW